MTARTTPRSGPGVSAALTNGPVSGPGCRAAYTRGCRHPSCAEIPGTALHGIPTTVLRSEARRRKMASKNRDVRANAPEGSRPGSISGAYETNARVRAAAVKMVRAYARRIGAGDVEDLAELASLHEVIEQAVGQAARELTDQDRDGRYSWTDIGRVLGTDRRTAWENYHDPAGERRKRGTQLRACPEPALT